MNIYIYLIIYNDNVNSNLFAKLLQDMEFRRHSGKFKSDTGTSIKLEGSSKFQNKLDKDCVIMFVDEVDNLDPLSDKEGSNITMMIMKEAYERRHDLSFIVAGYKDKVEKKWFAFNEGLAGRFPEDLRVHFDDYTEQELRLIFLKFVNDAQWRLELPENEEHIDVAQVAAARLARNRGLGFSNGRAVENLFRLARKRATMRQLASGITDRNDERIYTLKRCDVLGEKIDIENDPLMLKLKDMIGLSSVKRSIRSFVLTSNENFEKEMRGDRPFKMSLNRVFVGNPGTGELYTLCKLY